MMKWLKRLTISLLSLLALTLILLQIDDSLLPGPQAWIENADIKKSNNTNGYVFLMGIFANENASPMQVGLNRINNYQAAEQSSLPPFDNFTFDDYPDSSKLQTPESEYFCKKVNPVCFKLISENHDKITALLQKNHTLLTRYQEFLRLDDFHTILRPSMQEIAAPFEYLWSGNQALHLEIIRLAYNDQQTLSLQLLINDTQALRRQLEKTDTLIYKMVLVSIISENIELLSLLIKHKRYTLPLTLPGEAFKQLSLNERSLEQAMQREYLMQADMYQSLDMNPDFFEMNANTPGWIIRILYKPNMTLNSSYPKYRNTADLALISAAAFYKKVQEPVSDIPSFSLRNYIGSILSSIATPLFEEYIARFFDLDSKLKLLAIRMHLTNEVDIENFDMQNLAPLVDITNPYDDTPPFYDNETSKLCYSGPYEDQHQIRCLSI